MQNNHTLRVLSIDPGGTTGFCFAEGNATDGITVKPWQKRVNHTDLYKLLAELDLTDLVYETFEYRNKTRTKVDLTAKELIGVIKLWQDLNPHVHVADQSPMQGKSFYSNDVLREHGLYVRGRPHAMDATRHMMQWITFGAGFRYVQKVRNPAFTIVKGEL